MLKEIINRTKFLENRNSTFIAATLGHFSRKAPIHWVQKSQQDLMRRNRHDAWISKMFDCCFRRHFIFLWEITWLMQFPHWHPDCVDAEMHITNRHPSVAYVTVVVPEFFISVCVSVCVLRPAYISPTSCKADEGESTWKWIKKYIVLV